MHETCWKLVKHLRWCTFHSGNFYKFLCISKNNPFWIVFFDALDYRAKAWPNIQACPPVNRMFSGGQREMLMQLRQAGPRRSVTANSSWTPTKHPFTGEGDVILISTYPNKLNSGSEEFQLFCGWSWTTVKSLFGNANWKNFSFLSKIIDIYVVFV